MELADARRTRALLHTSAAPLGSCTAGTLRCADARSYQSVLRPCCRSHLRRIVSDTAELLREFGVTWWADYGTLLGAVRNPLTTWADYPWLQGAGPILPGVVPHDKDADFGVLFTDWQPLMRVRAALERKGYDVLVRSHGGSMKVRLSALNHTNLDLFTWRSAPKQVGQAADRLERVHYISVDAYKGRDFPQSWIEPMGSVEWEGLRLNAPANPSAFCAFRYGPAWQTPIPANHDGVKR